MNHLRSAGRLGATVLSVLLLAAACGGASAPSSPPTTGPTDPPVDLPASSPPDGSLPSDPGPGSQGKTVVPRPGQLDVHPVPADRLDARVDGHTIVVTATWTSGVEPCNVLDSIVVARSDGGYTITLREGHGPEEIACIAIAEQHRTEFEIPDVPSGTYTIVDFGGLAPPVEVTVG